MGFDPYDRSQERYRAAIAASNGGIRVDDWHPYRSRAKAERDVARLKAIGWTVRLSVSGMPHDRFGVWWVNSRGHIDSLDHRRVKMLLRRR